MAKRKRKTSSVAARGVDDLERNYISIAQADVTVKHDSNSSAAGCVTQLYRAGTQTVAYQLAQGSHTVEPNGYDHAAVYTGAGGKTVTSRLTYWAEDAQ